MLEVVSGRHNPLVDPTLHVWGWEIPVYLFLGGLAAGLLILTAAVELAAGRRPASPALRLMPLAALGVVSTGMLALFLDLEHKDHVLRFYLAFQPASPMSWGAWILVLVYPIGALFALGSLPPLWRRRWLGGVGGPLARLGARARAQRRTILWASIVAGAGLGVYTGLLLGTLSARPAWNSTILGPRFLASGLSTGAAFMLLFRPRREERERLVRWDLLAVLAEIALLALFLLDLSTGTQSARAAAGEFLGGKWTAAFWSLVVGAGLLVPLALELAESRRHLAPTVASPLLVLAGGLSLRFILLMAGQASSFAALP